MTSLTETRLEAHTDVHTAICVGQMEHHARSVHTNVCTHPHTNRERCTDVYAENSLYVEFRVLQ